MSNHFMAAVIDAAERLGLDSMVITPPGPGFGWSVKLASEGQHVALSDALRADGVACGAFAFYGRFYIMER